MMTEINVTHIETNQNPQPSSSSITLYPFSCKYFCSHTQFEGQTEIKVTLLYPFLFFNT